MSEIIRVDVEDRELGAITKEDAHKRPILHRAFSVFLFNGNKILLQRRHRDKYHSGGLVANACCSHPRVGETLEEAVPRRLEEEIGVRCDVKETFSFTYMTKYADDLYEYEYDHVFVGEYAGPIHPNPEEIETAFWMDIDKLKAELVSTPEKYSSWFLIAAPRVIAEREKAWEDIFFWQYDPRWTDHPYWEGDFGNDACGMVSLNMCVNALTGKTLDPLEFYDIRDKAGLDQSTMVNKEGTSVCGGDVQLQLNPINEKLFGVTSLPLERNEEAFLRVLSEGAWIWASAGKEADFRNKSGETRKTNGHIICIWKFDGEHYWVKDCHSPKEEGNNVLYTRAQMKAWIDSRSYQQYAIVAKG